MAKIHLIEPIVEEILINKPATRGDNFLLYVEVLKRFTNVKMSLESIFVNHKFLGIPALETITRCRRKLQETNPSLRDKKARSIRANEEEEYFTYSKE